MDLLLSKLLASFVLLLGTVLAGIAPFAIVRWLGFDSNKLETTSDARELDRLSRRRRYAEVILSWLLCFGGGVLFATCFVHMIPEVRENANLLSESEDLPITELLISCGFFLVYLIEEGIHTVLCLHSGHDHHVKEDRNIRTCVAEPDELMTCSVKEDTPSRGVVDRRQQAKDYLELDHPTQESMLPPTFNDDEEDVVLGQTNLLRHAPATANTTHSGHQHNSHQQHLPHSSSYGTIDMKGRSISFAGTVSNTLTGGSQWTAVPLSPAKVVIHPLRSLLIVVALSFHSIFEGLAVGLQASVQDIWYLVLGVGLHKFIITFCVGLELITISNIRRVMIILYITVFALVSPIGALIGTAISGAVEDQEASAADPERSPAVVVLQGLAAGTLLYVTFFEVLQRERERPGNGLMKVVWVVVGYGCMVGLELLNGHAHASPSTDGGSSNATTLAPTTSLG